MVTIECKCCGKIVSVSPYFARRGQKYCGKECADQAKRGAQKVAPIILSCLMCKKEFPCRPSWVKNGRRKFCSRACKNRHLSKVVVGEKHHRYGKAHTMSAKAKMANAARLKAMDIRGKKHPAWKGGTYIRHDGYRYVMVSNLPDDQRRMARLMRPTQDYIMEHRVVAAMVAGRPLLPNEVVHHRNGIRLDNRPQNLVLMDRGPHSRKHRNMERELAAAQADIAAMKAEIARLKS